MYTLGTYLGPLQDDHIRLVKRVTATERDIAEIYAALHAGTGQLNTKEVQLKLLEARAEDAANRAHHNNICIVGLPE
ncbi:hypothetical protein NDU88_006085 [Pleurodeles waltl]|uniref:Uncharacterized protein n=1 Tax=Pleurodeles waltl TaxID=8319 RepID=A0AAV7MB82_PLEWA|nr:hypothetical protein NDU88_006085 [Pleurodeles waltl]